MIMQPFQFHKQELRTFTDENGEPWFLAKDVCAGLDISNVSQACARLDPDEKMALEASIYQTYTGSHGGSQPIIISEPGLYNLVNSSIAPKAQEFKRWIRHEVLPSIRKTGSYQMPALTMEGRAKALAEYTLELVAKTEALEAKINEQIPDVEFAQAIKASEKSISINAAAKAIGPPCGQNNLYTFLREQGLLMSGGDDHNLPMQRFINQKLFEIDVKPHYEGEKKVLGRKTKVTGKGLAYITSLWNEKAVPYWADRYPKK